MVEMSAISWCTASPSGQDQIGHPEKISRRDPREKHKYGRRLAFAVHRFGGRRRLAAFGGAVRISVPASGGGLFGFARFLKEQSTS
jgi:hypothetical protein